MAERIAHCEACGEHTPHGSTGTSGPRKVGYALILASNLWLLLDWPLMVLCLPTIVIGLCLVFIGRERFSHIDCQRCRHKQNLQLRVDRGRTWMRWVRGYTVNSR